MLSHISSSFPQLKEDIFILASSSEDCFLHDFSNELIQGTPGNPLKVCFSNPSSILFPYGIHCGSSFKRLHKSRAYKLNKLFNKSRKKANKKNLPGGLLTHTLGTERQRESGKKDNESNGEEEPEEGQNGGESQNLRTVEVGGELQTSSTASPYSKHS